MFIGSYHHNLQGKRRLAIPSQFRESLGETAIITRGIEQCLQILPFNIWNDVTQNLGTHPLVGRAQRDMRRLLAHQAYSVEFDAQGRILIPQSLCDFATLSKTVVVAGSIQWIELWDVDLYKTYLTQIENQTETIAERIAHE